MKALRIGRIGSRDDFQFSLEGTVDAAGARALDRLLLECQARGATVVHLDFHKVGSVCSLGTTILARWGRVYEETTRRIHVAGLGGEVRAALGAVNAIVYEVNPPESTKGAERPSSEPAASPPKGPSPASTDEGSAAAASAAPLDPSSAHRGSVQSRLKRKVVEFRNLFEITQALNLAQDLDEVLNLFGLSVMGQFGLERLAVFLGDPSREGLLAPRHVRGFPQDHFRDFLIPADAIRGCAADRAFSTLSEMSGESGAWEGIEALRQSGFEWAVALWVRRDLEGVLLIGGRGSRREFEEDERDLVTILAHQGAVAIANARFHKVQEERNLGLVRGMMALIESRDTYAKGSTERVVRYVSAVARLMDYPKDHLKSLVYGAVLRDIGMLTVSGLLLKNPAHLSEDEWSLIKQHPLRGAQILEEMNFPAEVIEVVLNHHERWGGEGYPNGLRGKDIPLGARIVSLVDAYVAMTCERPYRRALPFDKARQVVVENWGTPFDPKVVEVFLDVLDKVERRSRLRTSASALGGPGGEPPQPAPGELDSLSSGATISTEARA